MVLFEPLPMARIGVRRADQKVVIASDFSTFGFMLEEFISLGATKIALPKSCPEIRTLSDMPAMLRRRISIVDDAVEREFVNRVLHPIRTEFKVKITEETGQLGFPKDLDHNVKIAIQNVHRAAWRLGLGFNHSLRVAIDPKRALSAISHLRKRVSLSDSRLVLAQLAAFFNAYEDIQFNAPKPNINVPRELISVFDRVVNDSSYLEFSKAVGDLANPKTRCGALSRVRTAGRKFMSSRLITTTWDYAAKLIQGWTGAPIPESGELASFISDRTFPALVDLNRARQSALQMWVASSKTSEPCSRSGSPYSFDGVIWLPPLKSLSPTHPDDLGLTLGTVGDLEIALQQVNCLLKKKLTRVSSEKGARKKSIA